MAIFGTALMAIFVVGFLCLCMFASWKLPTWSADGRFELVQSFTFLTSKFRLNTWWFGIALLLRGMCLSITVVLGTNQPEVQVALARVTLLIYLCSMVLVWPWKARALNLADTVLNSCLLLLVSQTVNIFERNTLFSFRLYRLGCRGSNTSTLLTAIRPRRGLPKASFGFHLPAGLHLLRGWTGDWRGATGCGSATARRTADGAEVGGEEDASPERVEGCALAKRDGKEIT
eukprot:g9718.t1